MDRAIDAFVIWIDGEAGAPSHEAAFAGRIEHVQTAARGTFASAQELLAFLSEHRRVAAPSSDEGET